MKDYLKRIKRAKELKNVHGLVNADDYKDQLKVMTDLQILEKAAALSDEEALETSAQRAFELYFDTLKEARARILEIHINLQASYYEIMLYKWYLRTNDWIRDEQHAKHMENREIVDKAATENNKDFLKLEEKFAVISDQYNVSYKLIYNRKLFMKSEEDLYKFFTRRNRKRLDKIAGFASEAKTSTYEYLRRENRLIIRYGIPVNEYRELKYFLKDEEVLDTVMASSDSMYLNKKYNKPQGVALLENKIEFNKFFKDQIGRDFWTNDEDATRESFNEFIAGKEKIFVKPTNSFKGRGARIVELEPDKVGELYDELIAGEEVLCEDLIVSHPDMLNFGAGSVNTVRMLTIQDNGEITPIYALWKIGGNSVVDNIHAGGYAAEIDIKTGQIISDAYDVDGNVVKTDLFHGTVIKGFQMPYWSDCIGCVKVAASKIPSAGFIGWDVAITADGPAIIEGNHSPQLNFIEHANPYGLNGYGHRQLIVKYLDEKQ